MNFVVIFMSFLTVGQVWCEMYTFSGKVVYVKVQQYYKNPYYCKGFIALESGDPYYNYGLHEAPCHIIETALLARKKGEKVTLKCNLQGGYILNDCPEIEIGQSLKVYKPNPKYGLYERVYLRQTPAEGK